MSAPVPIDRLEGGAKDAVPGAAFRWTFAASAASIRTRPRRLRALFRSLRPMPAHQVLKPVTPRARWSLYFIWAPDGQLDDAHRFTLDRLAERDAGVCVVVAAPEVGRVPAELLDRVDALWWKALPGYDFSAYAIGLHAIAAASPGADVLVMNDSVFGPLFPLEPLIDEAPWELTGMTASNEPENHIQSYAFHLRALTPARMRALGSVLPRRWSMQHFQDVVLCQETRLARVAARSLSTGAWWAGAGDQADLTLWQPLALVNAGLPFVKRSLLGKWAGIQPLEEVQAVLRRHGHPVPR